MQLALIRRRHRRVDLMDPAMQADLVAFADDAALLVRIKQRGRRPARRSSPRMSCFSQEIEDAAARRRGCRYWPQDSRPIDLPPSRSSLVSWSTSKESATAQRAPFFHLAA